MKKHILFFLPFLFLLTACKSPDYLLKPMDFKRQVKGLYFKGELRSGFQILSEIIEVNDHEIKLLQANDAGGVQTILKEKVQSGELLISLTSDAPHRIGVVAALINLAPIGHGFFMAFSVPINIIVTTAIANDAAKGVYQMRYPKDIPWEALHKFARFPQGIPKNIDPNEIR